MIKVSEEVKLAYADLCKPLSPAKIREQMDREFGQYYQATMETVLGRQPTEQEARLFAFKVDKEVMGVVAVFYDGKKVATMNHRVESNIQEGDKITFSWKMSKET